MTQTNPTLDVFGIGNALVDILAFVEDELIVSHGLQRGMMTLMDSEQQGKILGSLEDISLQLKSGGSAANTMIAIAQSGGNGYYAGKVSADPNGEFYRQDMLKEGILFEVPPLPESHGVTGTCVVLTTPDGERTLCTHLGVSSDLAETDIDLERLRQSLYCYTEGYLWSTPTPRKACITAIEAAKSYGIPVAFTFSDAFLVKLFADDFRQLITDYCDVLFCNADEVRYFCDKQDLTECATELGKLVDMVFITDSANGCLVVDHQEIISVPGFPVKPLDTVGAGDAFAGGVLFGLTHGYNLRQSARWGNYLGSEIVQIPGARLDGSQVKKFQEIINS